MITILIRLDIRLVFLIGVLCVGLNGCTTYKAFVFNSLESIEKTTISKAEVKASYRRAISNIKRHYTYDIPKEVCSKGDSMIIADYIKATYKHINPRLTPNLEELKPVETHGDSVAYYDFSQPAGRMHSFQSYKLEFKRCQITYIKLVGFKRPRGVKDFTNAPSD